MKSKRDKLYHRLTRPRAGLASYTSLWRGPDHLLLVRSSGYSEQYQRFNYADIRAFILAPSNARLGWNVVLAVLGLVVAGRLFVTVIDGEKPVVSGILLLALAALAIWNGRLGPTCKVHLVTGVQTVRLPFRRRRKAERVLAQLAPQILAAQADLAEPTALPVAPPPLA